MMNFVYVYDDAKPEQVKGKTIEDIRITDDCIEIKFTDGSEMEAKLVPDWVNYIGYESYYKLLATLATAQYEPITVLGNQFEHLHLLEGRDEA